MIDGVEADDVIGTLARASEGGAASTRSSRPATRISRSSSSPASRCVNTMSNETLDEAGVLAKFGVRADQVLDYLTLIGDAVDNVPGVDKVGPEDRRQVARRSTASLDNIVAHADEIGGVVGENLRERARLAAAGPAAAHGEDRLRRCRSACDALAIARADADALRRAVRALRVQELAARQRRRRTAGATGDAAGAIARRAARDDARPPLRRRRGGDADAPASRRTSLRDRQSTRRAFARWLDADRRTPSSSASTPRRRASIRCRRRSSACRSPSRPGSACYIPLAHRYAGAPDQLDRERVLARARAVARRPRRAQGRPERQVRPARARQPRHRARRRRARHAARVVRARVAQAARHGQPRAAAPRLEDDHLRRGHRQGREPDPLRPGCARARHRVFGRGCRRHAAAARHALSARSKATRSSRASIATIELPVREVLFRMERTRRADRRRAARRAGPRARRAHAGARAAGVSSSPASRSTSARRSSSARSCSSG